MKKKTLIPIVALAVSLMVSLTAGAAEKGVHDGLGFVNSKATDRGNDSTEFKSTFSLPSEDFYNELASLITYPEKAIAQGIEGEVRVLCTIDEEGNVTDVKILKDIGGDCALEVAQALRKMTFQPAIQNGYPRPLTMNIPVRFSLD